MKDIMRDCFSPHLLMHTLFGLGLGILAVRIFPGLALVWLGIGLMVVAVILDFMRKE